MPPGDEGNGGRTDGEHVKKLKGGVERGNMREGRNSAVLACCWDDWWEGGLRERVCGLMGRV